MRKEATLYYIPVGTSRFNSMSSDTEIKTEEIAISESTEYLFPNIKDL